MDKSVPWDPWDRFVHPYLTIMSDSYNLLRFVSDLLEFPKDGFSRVAAQVYHIQHSYNKFI